MSMPTLPRTSYARKMNGLSGLMGSGPRPASHDRDGLHLDQPVRMREVAHLHEGGRRPLLAEELFADRHEVGAVPDVGQVRVHLDDALHGSAARLDLCPERLEHRARLAGEVAAMGRVALV